MNYNEPKEVANILRAARNQLQKLRNTVDLSDANLQNYWKKLSEYNNVNNEILSTFSLMTREVVDTSSSVRKILGSLKDYPYWKKSLRLRYKYRLNYNLKMLNEQLGWMRELNRDLQAAAANRGPAYTILMNNWKAEWDFCCGNDLRKMLSRYIDALDEMIKECNAQVKAAPATSNARRGVPAPITVPTICPQCGVKNPIGHTYCLRCNNVLS